LILNNHPNPFKSTTTFSFNINSSNTQNAKLEIFNLKGQMVRQYPILSDQSSIIWDGTDGNGFSMPSGIYLYKIKAGKYTSTKKMILKENVVVDLNGFG